MVSVGIDILAWLQGGPAEVVVSGTICPRELVSSTRRYYPTDFGFSDSLKSNERLG